MKARAHRNAHVQPQRFKTRGTPFSHTTFAFTTPPVQEGHSFLISASVQLAAALPLAGSTNSASVIATSSSASIVRGMLRHKVLYARGMCVGVGRERVLFRPVSNESGRFEEDSNSRASTMSVNIVR